METGIGKRIKKRRIELNLTQEELAKRMGYKSKAAICKVEGGEDNITSDRIVKFAEALETTPAYLMGWEDDDLEVVDLSNVPDASAEEIQKAMEFYERFNALSPEKQAALLTLLEVPRNDA